MPRAPAGAPAGLRKRGPAQARAGDFGRRHEPGVRVDSGRHAEAACQPRGVVRRVHLDVVVEIAEDVAARQGLSRFTRGEAGIGRLAAASPAVYPPRPVVERRVTVAARVQLDVAVQAQIDEVGGEVFEQRPASGGVGDDQRDSVPMQQGDEFGSTKLASPWKEFRLDVGMTDKDGEAKPEALWWKPRWSNALSYAGSGTFEKQ